MTAPSPVLVSWIAVESDPYQRERDTGTYRLEDGKPVPGPTLALLLDEASPYRERIRDAVFFHRANDRTDDREKRAVAETRRVLRDLAPDLRVQLESWEGDDPTEHRAIFAFLREKMPEIRRRFAGRELIVHVSPGTPSMQTVWVLMGETGFVEPPFRLVKSYRRADRKGRPAVVPVEVGIETFYKVYKASRPSQVGSEEQSVVLDPQKFRTERMRALFTEARRYAHVNVPVLLLGERGTGKTTLAAWIRLHSPYRKEEQDAHWPAVACGQYSAGTMRAELFGYKKGAFTDARKDKEGLLKAADGDTLFLDEVGDVSRDLQRLLIKALDEKRYFPIGGDRPRKSDFRLLTATNIGTDKLHERLDPDFLDRIGFLKLHVPALREIRDDLQWLWESAYEQAARRAGLDPARSHLDIAHHRHVVGALAQHPLPGNLRDLMRVAYRILAARSDPHDPLAPEDAVRFGLEALSEGVGTEHDVPRSVAAAFSQSRPLDAIVERVGTIPTDAVQQEMKRFMAEEIRRIAKARGVSPDRLCDVTDRALREWVGGREAPKNSSGGRKSRSASPG